MKETDGSVRGSNTPSRKRQSQGTPRWVKAIGILVAVLVAVVIALHIAGLSPGGHFMHHGAAGHGQ